MGNNSEITAEKGSMGWDVGDDERINLGLTTDRCVHRGMFGSEVAPNIGD